MNPKTVLAVDDEPHLRFFLSALLTSGGYRAVTARDGREGLKKARELRPDLIILDVMMPGEGGVPMYRQLRSDPDLASTPVIVLSAVEGRTFAHSLAMMNLGPGPRLPEPEAYIEKPPAPEVLLRKVAAIIGPPVDPPTEPEPGTSSAPSKGPETS